LVADVLPLCCRAQPHETCQRASGQNTQSASADKADAREESRARDKCEQSRDNRGVNSAGQIADPAVRTQWIIERARREGFDLCGVARVDEWPELARLPEWLERGHAGEMKYLHDARRNSIESAMRGASSVIVCALKYNSAKPYSTEAAAANAAAIHDRSANGDSPRGWISRYAWGEDYHEVIGGKLEAIIAAMRCEFAEPFNAKSYVDTGPILERVAALHAGIGWLAKNTLLINREIGSWLFLGVILTTLELAPTASANDRGASDEANVGNLPPQDLCGQCSLCIDACPTEAIVEPYLLDARKCISYLTIELRGAIPEELRGKMGRQVFGCDICQDVCPWNRDAAATTENAFQAREKFFAPELEWIAAMSEEEFRAVTKNNPLKRAKWRGLIRNACVALGNSKIQKNSAAHGRIAALLERLANSTDELIAEHACWALDRLRLGAER
jgi:epoxyqueuosine reductase